MKLPLLYEDIAKILPHRYPFLLVDRTTKMDLLYMVVFMKSLSINEPFFQGHYPGNPVMPGVLIIEAMAQVGGVLARLSVSGALEKEGAIFFMAIDKVKFRKPVLPGDQIIFELVPLRTGSKIWKMAGKAFVNDKLVTEAELLATIA